MQKYGFIAMAALALGGIAVLRAPVLASEAAPVPFPKVPAFADAGANIAGLARELKLTNAQQQQLAAIHQEIEQQFSDLRGNSLLSPADKKRQVAALHEGFETSIKAILTSDQIAKFDQMGGLKALMESPAAGGESDGLEALNLTPAQKAAIEGIKAQSKQAFEAAAGDVTKLGALKQATRQRIMAVLTPAQQQQLAAGGPDASDGFEALNLTLAQKAAIEGIKAQSKQAFEAAGGDVTKLGALKQATQQRIMAVLTPAQQQQLRAMQVDPSR